ncbi:MAG: helix-turn-helix domain-containing protein [Anaeroplasmataceae bacterium]|nr:helix-turn-helix domain-containing protein [Anaeroplasmataceae bacterium]
MKKYILIKTAKENYPYILNVFKMLAHNCEILEDTLYLKLSYQDIEDEEIEATIQSLEGDLNALISYYVTSSKRPEKEIAIIEKLFFRVAYGHYHLKSLAIEIKNKADAMELFDFIVEGSGITREIIFAMADCDLNVSKASVLLYMHRNTLIYKIERLIELQSFDLKSFNDLYLLVQLLKA